MEYSEIYYLIALLLLPAVVGVLEQIAIFLAPATMKPRVTELGEHARTWAVGFMFCTLFLVGLATCVNDPIGWIRAKQCMYDPSC